VLRLIKEYVLFGQPGDKQHINWGNMYYTEYHVPCIIEIILK